MNLTVETIEALRHQGLPSDAILDALQAALKARIEQQRAKDRERQQRSRAARRPRRAASSEAGHSDTRDPLSNKKEGSPHTPLKKKTNSPLPKPPSSASATAEAAEGTRLPDDWTPREDHVHQAEMACQRALDPEIAIEFVGLDHCESCIAMSVETFALQFVEEQTKRFRGWATTWRRTHPDWDARFSEWLRIEFSRLAKAKQPIRTICDAEFGPTVSTLDDFVWRLMHRVRHQERTRAL